MKAAANFAMLASLMVALSGVEAIAQAAPGEHTTTLALQQSASLVAEDQQPTPEQLTKLFEVMRLRQQMDSVTRMMPAMIQQQVESQSKELSAKLMPGVTLSPAQEEATRKITQKYMERAASIYPVGEMIEDMKGLYQRHLTRTDVDAFIAFYSSPAGQHLLDAQPVIMQEYMPIVMKRMQERSKQLTDELEQDLQELIKSATPKQ
jgi:hypothetical protein